MDTIMVCEEDPPSLNIDNLNESNEQNYPIQKLDVNK